MKKLLALLAFAIGTAAPLAHASESSISLDHFPAHKLKSLPALQNGAKLFVNYCLNCHATSAMRYNRLQELGLTPEQISESLLFSSTKVGDLMTIAAKPADQKVWFGAPPPDLSLTARSRSSPSGSGASWIYTYLRSFYRDAERPTGWNNTVFANVNMPHVLWELQGARTLTQEETKKVADPATKSEKWARVTTTWDEFGVKTVKQDALPEGGHYHEGIGRIDWKALEPDKARAYDEQIADIVAYMSWVAEPVLSTRYRLGVIVLMFLGVFSVLAWGLNRAYWKNIK
ncbi:MAG TPA: cytochrome c1 [Burkholderiaceae bacterium]|nr:cytochrome c1 [Burkholderiaceae bacterium]